MTARCKWFESHSYTFDVPSGVKQGGVLSPHFFAVYVDELICILRKLNRGCKIGNLFIACLFYADDLTLLSPIRSVMQKLLDACYQYGEKYCLSFNLKKTKTIVFGKKLSTLNCIPLYLNDREIEYVQEWKYLGTTLKRVDSAPFIIFSCSEDLAKFYRASNAVLNAIKKPSENVLMHLLFTNCVTILTYAADVKEYTSREMSSLNTAINNCIRRIFSFSRSECTCPSNSIWISIHL